MLKKIFFFLLGCGLVCSLIQKDNIFSDYENRTLQMFPKFSFERLTEGTFTTEFDTYVSDQFPLRNQWITLKTLSDIHLFQKTALTNVYLGKDDYLLNRYTEKDFSQDTLQKNLSYLNQFAKQYQTQIILVPTASEVLTDELPNAYYHLTQDSLLSEAPASTLFAGTILKSHTSEPIYFKTDHHWTLLGAYYLYESLSKNPIPYEVTTVSTSFYGTTYRKLNRPMPADTLERIISPYEFRVSYDNGERVSTLYNEAALNKVDKYPFYLDGNHATTHIRNEGIATNNSLLIIKDSFANSFATLICNDYKDVYLIDLRYFNGSISAYIKENQIQETMFLYNNINFMQDKNLAKLLY